MALQKPQKVSSEDIESRIIDATEQLIERPKRPQKSYYSGKKKRPTMKTEIRVTCQGRIVNVSKSYPGLVHDFTIVKSEKPLPKEIRLFVDSGYQGIADSHSNADLPYKSLKNKPLNVEEKDYDTTLSRFRVVVENIFGDIKTFKIMSDRYTQHNQTLRREIPHHRRHREPKKSLRLGSSEKRETLSEE